MEEATRRIWWACIWASGQSDLQGGSARREESGQPFLHLDPNVILLFQLGVLLHGHGPAHDTL